MRSGKRQLLKASPIVAGCLILSACGGASVSDEASATNPSDAELSRAATLAATCSGCHAKGGSALADISDYSETRLAGVLRDYRTDGPTAMHRIARGYSDDEIQLIAAYLGAPED